MRTALREREREVAELQAGGPRVAELEAELARRGKRISALESELEDALAWTTPTHKDDLTRVRGIGPKFADKLQAVGVDKLSQIATWTPARIEEVARALRIHPSRIERDGWVESARALMRES